MIYGDLVMSYNMIDFNFYEKIDCSVEQHYHRKFATYQKYRIKIPDLSNHFSIDIDLIIEENEANDSNFAEVVISKKCNVTYNNLYNSNPIDKLFKGLDAILNPYYIVELDSNNDIILTAKIKGKVPSIQTPKILSNKLTIIEECSGRDTEIFVSRPNEIHLPRTTFGKNYIPPQKGDIVYIIDSVVNKRDKTFIREITDVIQNGKCTCDILTLNLPIDRLDNTDRINGIGLQRNPAISNNYTASFSKTQIWKRKENFKDLLLQNQHTGKCVKPIGNFMNMKNVVNEIINNLHHDSFSYYGTNFHWTKFQTLLLPFYKKFGQFLCDELFLLKSSVNRPDYLVHIDYDESKKNLPVVGSFTWPALNCTKDTITVWYDCYKNNEKIYRHGEQDKVITNNELRLEEIDRYIFDSEDFNAVLFKHNDWHTLYNTTSTKKERMLLQWRFKPELTWEKICEIVLRELSN
jgi:hypothetical protein